MLRKMTIVLVAGMTAALWATTTDATIMYSSSSGSLSASRFDWGGIPSGGTSASWNTTQASDKYGMKILAPGIIADSGSVAELGAWHLPDTLYAVGWAYAWATPIYPFTVSSSAHVQFQVHFTTDEAVAYTISATPGHDPDVLTASLIGYSGELLGVPSINGSGLRTWTGTLAPGSYSLDIDLRVSASSSDPGHSVQSVENFTVQIPIPSAGSLTTAGLGLVLIAARRRRAG